jgi:hypothetical protein
MSNDTPNMNDPLAFLRNMWSGMGVSMPGIARMETASIWNASPGATGVSVTWRLRLVPAVIRQYSNVKPRLVSSRRSASVNSALVEPGP